MLPRDEFRWSKVRDLHTILSAVEPNLFSLDAPVPFKIGLHADILAEFPDVNATLLARMFVWLAARSAYYLACVVDAPRCGLHGEKTGFVTGPQAKRAATMLRKKLARKAAKADLKKAA